MEGIGNMRQSMSLLAHIAQSPDAGNLGLVTRDDAERLRLMNFRVLGTRSRLSAKGKKGLTERPCRQHTSNSEWVRCAPPSIPVSQLTSNPHLRRTTASIFLPECNDPVAARNHRRHEQRRASRAARDPHRRVAMGVLPLPARAAAGAAVATPVPARSQRPQTHLRLDATEGGGASSATANAGAGRAASVDGADPGAL
ncbi:hypothetical protein VFPBJ_05899 [Purpureocillium lilacinum]|uniref:Uncharacterized protein n=1 Tax=Purpureocillium lilacinum TaxID=33203 RepID=A0A179GR04_PURLI|nr:hypothetical protein VFPBJ_05899 [Purpureocillium lilacinum]